MLKSGESLANDGTVGTVARRDSFQRLDDDLSEEVLSYLPLKNKFRFECLCKRWQRLIFNKVFQLKTNEVRGLIPVFRSASDPEITLMDLQHFATVLKKCRFLRYLSLHRLCGQNREQLFDLVFEYCKHLTDVNINFSQISRQTIDKFFIEFGPKLKTFHFRDNSLLSRSDAIRGLQLKNVFTKELYLMIGSLDSNAVLVRNAKRVQFDYSLTADDRKRFELFVADNGHSLEAVDCRVANHVMASAVPSEAFDGLLRQMAALTRLKRWTLQLRYSLDDDIAFEQRFRQIGQKCINLKSFSLKTVRQSNQQILQLFDAIQHLKRLQRLEVVFEFHSSNLLNLFFSSQTLSAFKDLTHLTVRGIPITDLFFKNIDKNLPKLEFLYVSNAQISISSITGLSLLPQLFKLHLKTRHSNISETDVQLLTQKSPKLKELNLFSQNSEYNWFRK